MTLKLIAFIGVLAAFMFLAPPVDEKVEPLDVELKPLFASDGVVKEGWTVREWDDVSEPPHKPVEWIVKDGVLHGTGGLPDEEWIGTWLLSEKEYENFVVDFEFHLGKDWGNGGFAIRAPLDGDPAMDGMELQLTEPHYQFHHFPEATPAQLTGAIYLAVAPKKRVYKPNEWNHLRIELRGPSLRAWLNGELIQNANLDEITAEITDPESGRKLLSAAKRPRKGHLGFQDLSGEGGQLRVRNAKFAELP